MTGRQSYILGCDFAIHQLTKKGSEFYVVHEGNQYIQVAWKDILEWLEKEYNKQEPTTKNDLALIHTEGLDESIRCAMCTNVMQSDRGCDGACVVNTGMYKKVMDVIENHIADTDKMLEPKESEVINEQM